MADSTSILLVEDSEESANLVRRCLKDEPAEHALSVVGTLAECRERLVAEPPDIILLDLKLPDCTGLDTVDAVHAVRPEVPVVVLTQTEDAELALIAVQRGCQDYLFKRHLNGDMLWRVIRYAIERARIQHELRDARARFEDYAAAASDWFWEMGPDLRFVEVSHGFSESTGLDGMVLTGRTLGELVKLGPAGQDAPWFLRRLEKREPFRNFEIGFRDGPEDIFWLRFSGRPLLGRDGRFMGYRGTGQDITLERHADWELKRNKALVDGILYASLEGFVVLTAVHDLAGRVADFSITHCNRRAEEILKKSRYELLGTLLKREMPWLVEYGVFDRAKRTVESGASFDMEQYYDRNGMSGWFRIVGSKLNEGVVLNLSDISARKEAERERRLAAAVFQNSYEAMMIADSENRILAVNPSFTRVTGYTVDEALGRTPKFLRSGLQPVNFYAEMWASLERNGHWVGEVLNRKKSGDVYVQRQTISCIYNANGVLTNFVNIFSDITEEKEDAKEHAFHLNHDALTGLPNHVLLRDRVIHGFQRVRREGRALSILHVDVDDFRPINDKHGHVFGDRLLRLIAQRLQGAVRASDTIARFAGDEFVIVLPDSRIPTDAEVLAEKICASFATPFRIDDLEAKMTVSIGISLHPNHGENLDTLLRHATNATNQVKHEGKNGWRTYKPMSGFEEF